jgi:hypothetical protein
MPAKDRRWIPREELAARLAQVQADPGLRDDLARLGGETTDDLEPLNPDRTDNASKTA